MLKIDEETMGIAVSRGDFSTLRFSFFTGTAAYVLVAGDRVIFTVKQTAVQKKPVLVLQAENPGESYVEFCLEEGDLAPLPFGDYVYDVRLRFANGRLWTPPKFPAAFAVKEVVGNG